MSKKARLKFTRPQTLWTVVSRAQRGGAFVICGTMAYTRKDAITLFKISIGNRDVPWAHYDVKNGGAYDCIKVTVS